MHNLNILMILAFSLGAIVGDARADECTPPSNGPDVILGGLMDFGAGITKFGTIGDITAFAMSTDACNIGDVSVLWDSTNHPHMAQNLYRIWNNRFEQIGMSWIKHGFSAGAGSTCCTCVPSPDPGLDPGCSDVYGTGLNGSQCSPEFGGLGPRSLINAFSGTDGGSNNSCGNAIFKRLQVHTTDLDPTLHPGARYFGEGHYVAADDAAADNAYNNASYREVLVTGFSNDWTLTPTGVTHRRKFAIQAWQDVDPAVQIQNVDIPGEGRFILAYSRSSNGNGTWHFEYALFNMNSHRSARSFSVPLGVGVTVSNIGFHDVDYHSGEPYDLTDWPGIYSNGIVSWSTDSFETNPNANALRWSTLYNFRFDADTPQIAASVTIGLFRPGTPETVSVATPPPPIVPTASMWGLIIMGLVLCTAATSLILVQRSICEERFDNYQSER